MSERQRRARGGTVIGRRPLLPPAPLPSRSQDQWLVRVLGVAPPVQRDPSRPPPTPPLAPQRPPQLQQAINARLMTFDELSNKIGHDPHADKTFKNPITGKVVTVRKMSTNYKQVQSELGATNTTIEEAGKRKLDDFDPSKRKEVEEEITAQLDVLRWAANAYKTQHRKDTDKTAAVDEFLTSIDKYQASLKSGLDAILADPAFDKVKGQINLEQALHAKRCGINFGDCDFAAYNDDNASEIDDKFGAGVANSVSRIKYTGGQERVFKKEKASESFLEQLPIARAVGIDGEAPHNGNRNIATGLISDLLGTTVVPKVSYGLHANPQTGEDEIGLMMERAPGVTPLRTNDKTGMKERRQLWDPSTPPSPTARAKLQQQLSSLDWCDVITGQQDRHGSNYMVDIQGDNVVVTGIDNDVSFGGTQTDPSASKMNYGSRTTPPGMPPLIDKAVYEKLMGTDFERDVAPTLGSLLTKQEVDAARSRFNTTKDHAKGLSPDFVVSDWSGWRSPDPDNFTVGQFLKQAGTGVGSTSSGGLFGRDFAAMFDKEGLL
jgi:hypothetical protein